MTAPFTALWSAQEPAKLTVTDGSSVVASLTLSLPVRRPSPQTLDGTEWSIYPGQAWEEDPPGEWAVPVFSFERLPPQRGGNEAADHG